MVARPVEPGVHEAEGEVASVVGGKIHDDEGHVVDHVDPAQRRVEFNAVEGHHVAVKAHQVGQVQVAMAFADAAVCQAGVPEG